MIAVVRSLVFCGLLLFAGTPALAGDPHAPQLNVSFLAPPAPIVQNGATRLFYEMLITNFAKTAFVLDAIEAKAGDTQSKVSGTTLSPLMIHLGAPAAKDDVAARTLESGRSVMIFLTLDLGKTGAPSAVAQTLHVIGDKNDEHDIVLAPLPIANESPIVVAPPLRGTWIAGNSVNNLPDAAHRRAVIVDSGHAWLAQRYAIDWVQIQTVDGAAATFKGAEDKNDSYFCYNQPIYSVAAGKVVDMSDGMPENVPHSGAYAVPLDFNNAAGNHIVVEIAPHRYVLYAHMRPGTVRSEAWRSCPHRPNSRPCRQYRQLGRAASAHAYRRSAVVSRRQRRALRLHARRSERAGRGQCQFADRNPFGPDRAAAAVQE